MFVDEGATVVLVDVSANELHATGDAINETHPESARAVALDVTRPEQWRDAVAVAEHAFGALHILVNNAGITNERYGGLCDIEDMTLEAWNGLLEVNLTGVFLGMKSAIPLLRSSIRPLYEQNPRATASIVNISSAQAIRPSPGQSNYAASKWAVRGLTKVAASELGPMIRVNSVHPGPIDTPMIAEMLKTNVSVLQSLIADTPLERVGTAEEVAALVLFLAGDESSYCTGAEFLVEGGRTSATVAKK